MILELSRAKKLPLVTKVGPSEIKNVCLERTHSQNAIINELPFTIGFQWHFVDLGTSSGHFCLWEDLTLRLGGVF